LSGVDTIAIVRAVFCQTYNHSLVDWRGPTNMAGWKDYLETMNSLENATFK